MLSPIRTLYTYFPLQFFICLTLDLLLVACGIFLAVRLFRKGRFDRGQVIACIVLFVWYAAVLFLTVLGRRSKDGFYGINLDLFCSYREIFEGNSHANLTSVLQNILMFVPIGFTLSVVFKNKHRFIIPLLISIGLSLLIETSQLLLQSGYFELDDLFNNTLGGFIGIVLYLAAIRIRIIIYHSSKENQ